MKNVLKSVYRRLPYPLKALLAIFIPKIRQSLLSDPSIVRDYRKAWVDPAGYAYRMKAYEKQRKGGEKPLLENPTVDEVRAALQAHSPESVLEIGCGWGRLLEELYKDFKIEGCDISPDMLKLCPPYLSVFEHDIAAENPDYYRQNANRWDILFTRGVMLYIVEKPDVTLQVMKNMSTLAQQNILIWEWPEVCAKMQTILIDPKFEYHPIERRDE
ncbi:MAG: class I SAM-dependent methyltransferase [Chloroflexota bacterium]